MSDTYKGKTRAQLIEELERFQNRLSELDAIQVEHQVTRKALWESEERYRQLVESVNDIIYVTDSSGVFTYVNPAAMKIVKYPEAEIRRMHYLDLVKPDFRERLDIFYREQYAKKIPATYREFPIIDGKGGEAWIGQNVQLIVRDDDVIGFQAVARDITEHKRAEDELKRRSSQLDMLIRERTAELIAANEKLQVEISERRRTEEAVTRQRDELKSINRELKTAHEEVEFFNDLLSHDIKNYTNIASGFLQILLKGRQGELSGDQRESMEVALRQMGKITRLVNNVFTLSQVRRLQDSSLETLDLHTLIVSAVEWVKTACVDKPLRISYCGDRGRYVRAHPIVSGMIENLLDNSIKHNSNDEIQITLDVKGERREGGEFWKIDVEDNADGIPDSYKRKVFERYERRSKQSGTGLGLALVKTVVDRLGGYVQVRDRVPGQHERGAVFGLALPKASTPK